MGKRLHWEALPTLIDMLGITDPELLILQLVALRDTTETAP